MREVESVACLLDEHLHHPAGKNVMDVGCGDGEVTRWLSARGARVVAIDCAEVLAHTRGVPRAGDEVYVAASGECLPLPAGWADVILYVASLHHLPSDRLDEALGECRRVLKSGGRALVIEPVYQRGSYRELANLVHDEREVQRLACQAIGRAAGAGLEMVFEEQFSLPRSFRDFEELVSKYVDDPARAPAILARARAITIRRARAGGVAFDEFRYRSPCRLNILAARG